MSVRLDAARFRTALVDACSRAHKSGAALSVWWLDVDDCSALNDQYGEATVDEALHRIDKVLDSGGVTFMRMGAGWAAFAPMSLSGAAQWVEQLRVTQAADAQLSISLSGGVAAHKKGEPALNLLEAAELACTRAKQGGRGLVVTRDVQLPHDPSLAKD